MGHTFSIFKESTSANLLFCYITEEIFYQIAAFLPFLIISLCILYESSLFGKYAQIYLNIFVQILVLKFSLNIRYLIWQLNKKRLQPLILHKKFAVSHTGI